MCVMSVHLTSKAAEPSVLLWGVLSGDVGIVVVDVDVASNDDVYFVVVDDVGVGLNADIAS